MFQNPQIFCQPVRFSPEHSTLENTCISRQWI
jgi:hypothetical protein